MIQQDHRIDQVLTGEGAIAFSGSYGASRSMAYSQSLLAAPKKHRTVSLLGLEISAAKFFL
ncbi:MAG: hypothetical protein F6K55_17975 [Moorea sp. SIO4A3]|nr:hypothetical protein [Moorena sp. SIO4A3]